MARNVKITVIAVVSAIVAYNIAMIWAATHHLLP